MIDNQKEIEPILQNLANDGLVLFPTISNWVIAVDATNIIAVEKLNNVVQNINNQYFIVYFSDERMMMQHIATVDLELFNFLDEQTQPTAFYCNHILSIAENALDNLGAAFTVITANDDFTKTIIKRFRKPLYGMILPNSTGNSIIESFKKIPDSVIAQANYIFPIQKVANTNFSLMKFYKLADNHYIEMINYFCV